MLIGVSVAFAETGDGTQERIQELKEQIREAEKRKSIVDKMIEKYESEIVQMNLEERMLDKQLEALSGYDGENPDGLPEIADIPEDLREQSADLVEQARSRMAVLHSDEDILGMAFICGHEGGSLLYTSAALISGADDISAHGVSGEEFPLSSKLSCASGIGMVGLHPEKTDLPHFELSTSNALPQVDDQILVIAYDKIAEDLVGIPGTIRGLGPDVWEIDAELTSGMSGSPVVALNSGKVIGIVATQIEGVGDDWAKGTRHENKRSFALRLDRISGWDTVEIARFEKEAKYLENFEEENYVAWLAYMIVTGVDVRSRSGPYMTADERRNYYENMRHKREMMKTVWTEAEKYENHEHIKLAYRWREEGRKKDGVFDRDSVYRRLANDLGGYKDLSGKFTWYHDERHTQALETRKVAIQSLEMAANGVGR